MLVQDCCFIVVGSNGLIGSCLNDSLIAIAKTLYQSAIDHQCIVNIGHEKTSEAVLNILKDLDHMHVAKIVIVLAHGNGGFLLTSEPAEKQLWQFQALVSSLNVNKNQELRLVLISSLGALSSKLDSEYRLLSRRKEAYINNLAFNSLIIRLPSIWGFNQSRKPKGLIGHLIFSAYTRTQLNIYGALETTRNYLFAESACHEVSKLIWNFGQEQLSSSCTLNIRSRYFSSIGDLINTMKRVLPSRSIIYQLNCKDKIHKESHTYLPDDGVDLILNNCMTTEVKQAWNQISYKRSL